MLLGIMSDSHDDRPNFAKAIRIFNENKVDRVYHAGDIHTPDMRDVITDIRSPTTFDAVFGNSDVRRAEFCKINGGRFNFHHGALKFSHEGKRFLMSHEPENIKRHAGNDRFDCIIHGHTHAASAEFRDGVLYLNPGETTWKRSTGPTIALLDVPSLEVRFVLLT